MFPLRSTAKVVERKANKKTVTACPITARKKPIRLTYGSVNRVRRIGALSRGKTKKLPWARATAAELTVCLPAKATDPKEVRRLMIGGCRGGVTRPSGSLADWRPGYTRLNATAADFSGVKLGTTPRFSVGATTDPRHGCAVNTAECVGRQVRFTSSPVERGGLNGWRTVACAPENDSNALKRKGTR